MMHQSQLSHMQKLIFHFEVNRSATSLKFTKLKVYKERSTSKISAALRNLGYKSALSLTTST